MKYTELIPGSLYIVANPKLNKTEVVNLGIYFGIREQGYILTDDYKKYHVFENFRYMDPDMHSHNSLNRNAEFFEYTNNDNYLIAKRRADDYIRVDRSFIQEPVYRGGYVRKSRKRKTRNSMRSIRSKRRYKRSRK